MSVHTDYYYGDERRPTRSDSVTIEVRCTVVDTRASASACSGHMVLLSHPGVSSISSIIIIFISISRSEPGTAVYVRRR